MTLFEKRILRNPIPLPLATLTPTQELFSHPSEIHGQAHVARVLIHAFLLIDLLELFEEASRLWAAVYLHDLAREHDGYCLRHGADAITKLDTLPQLKMLFASGGVKDSDYEAITTAVHHHSLPGELPLSHRHHRLTALLKDADGLDRVRLGDLDPRYFRFDVTNSLAPFAQELFTRTYDFCPSTDGYFAQIWPEARQIWEEGYEVQTVPQH